MNQSTLYSIGHGVREKEVFVELLQQYGIQYLLDVRSIPYSRFNPQYRQQELIRILSDAKIRYVYMGDTLGGRPKDPACYKPDGKISYDLVASTSFFREGIARLKTAYDRQVLAAIMCSETKPEDCHRSKLIGNVLLETGIDLLHIDAVGGLKKQTALIGLGL
jgi:uncharacterized protein (DUF488 family)